MKKFDYSINETATLCGFLVPTQLRGTGGVRPQPVRRHRGMTDAASRVATSATGVATPGLPSSAPPIT